jgi:hypothetical protein
MVAALEEELLNIENIRAVAARIRALKPVEYNQEELGLRTHCGTAACIAGHAVLQHGGTLLFREDSDWSYYCALDDEERDTWDAGMEVLGLNSDEAESLFGGDPLVDWPEPWGERYEDAPANKRHLVAADLLDAIADGKVKL